MAETILETDETETEDPRDGAALNEPLPHSWVVSLLFWMSLLLAASMYGAVALSPKLAEWIRIRQQYTQNAVRLVELEDDIDYLERISTTLRQDPEFTRRLAHASLPAERSGQDFVPVTEKLMFGGTATNSQLPRQTPDPPFAAMIFHIASDLDHRRMLLVTAGVLVLLSFTLLNESGAGVLSMVWRCWRWLWRFPFRRYWEQHHSLPTTGARQRESL